MTGVVVLVVIAFAEIPRYLLQMAVARESSLFKTPNALVTFAQSIRLSSCAAAVGSGYAAAGPAHPTRRSLIETIAV